MDSHGEPIKRAVIIVSMKYFGRVGVYAYVFAIVELPLPSEFRV
jgi:hypothetical protein